jgi:hypothetical protein
MTKRDSQLLQQTFASVDDVGERKEMFYGLWSTIADIRGLSKTEPGQLIVRRLTGKGDVKFQVGRFGDEFEDLGALPSDYNEFVSAPSLVDIDRAAARSTLVSRMLGTANKDWVDKMTGAWSFLTLAGPRYAIRNATEDLMVALAIGQVTPWGLAKSRYLSTRINTALGVRKGLTKGEKIAEDPLGSVMRILNKNEAGKYQEEIAGLDDAIRNAKSEIKTLRAELKATDKVLNPGKVIDIERRIDELRAKTQGGLVQQTRNILARSLSEGRVNRLRTKLGANLLDDEELQLLAEQITYGNIDNTLSVVSEGGFNFVTGNDYITRTVNFQKATGVRMSALEINVPSNMYSRARGERGFKKIALGQQDEAAMIAWLMRISYYANDELGAIALANVDSPDVVKLVYDWIIKHPEFTKNARLAAQGVDEMQHAKIVVNRAKEIVAKRKLDDAGNAVINKDLLDKMRVYDDEKGQYVITGRLSLDDLPENLDDIPEYVIGPTLVPVADAGSYTASIMTKGWTWLGLANARLSREPLVINEMVKIRKQMKKTGFYDAYINSFVKNVDQTKPAKVEAATNLAKRKLAEAI